MTSYPLAKYHFRVDWGGAQVGLMEVSGLSMEFAVIEHRDGASPTQSASKMPGLRKFTNIILKRGVAAGDNEFILWINTVQSNSVERRDVLISLLDSSHSPILSWRVRKAWPCKYSVSDLNASANEVVIETIELAHEGLELVS